MHNGEASKIANCVILTISNDLPFAQQRFCESEYIDKVITLSQLRNMDFGRTYGVEIIDGLLVGLLATIKRASALQFFFFCCKPPCFKIKIKNIVVHYVLF